MSCIFLNITRILWIFSLLNFLWMEKIYNADINNMAHCTIARISYISSAKLQCRWNILLGVLYDNVML